LLDEMMNAWLPHCGLAMLGEPDFLERYTTAFDPATGQGRIDAMVPLKERCNGARFCYPRESDLAGAGMKAFVILAAAAFVLTACSDDDQRYLFTYERPDASVHNTTIASNAPPAQPVAAPPATPVPPPAPVQSEPLPPPPQAYSEPPPRPAPPMERRVPATPAEVAAPPPIDTYAPPVVAQAAPPPAAMPTQTVSAPAEQVPIPPQPAVEAQCRAVAQQRAEDGRLNGFDEDTQKVIEDGTYRDCMTWTPTHN
jgi:hypothetical protein